MPFDIYILSFKDILDILLVAFLLYKSYKLMKSSGSINIQTPQQQPVPFPERQQKDGHRKRRHHAYRDGLPEYE